MEQEKILMGQKQLQRWHLVKMVEVGKITLREAGERLGVSYRQAKRIGRAIRERGMKGLVHGNKGRPSNNRLKEATEGQRGGIPMSRYPKGFTLIELIVIIVIVGLLGAIAIVKYTSMTADAERASVESVIGSLRSAFSLYSAKQIVDMQPITAHNPFDDLSEKPPNYVGTFGDVNSSNCQTGEWAYQSGDSSNGNWPVVVYRPIATLVQAFNWDNKQWIVLVVNEIKNVNGTTVMLSLDDYPPAHQW